MLDANIISTVQGASRGTLFAVGTLLKQGSTDALLTLLEDGHIPRSLSRIGSVSLFATRVSSLVVAVQLGAKAYRLVKEHREKKDA